MKKILFLGQKPIGEKCFQYLINNLQENFKVCGVVSNQSKDEVWWKSNRIYEYAQMHQITFIDNAKRNNKYIHTLILEEQIDIILSVQHSWILPAYIIEAVNHTAFNLHNAKLPDYKGHNICSHAILNGETEYTSTIHWLIKEVDMGDIAYEKSFPILPDDTAKTLYDKAQNAGFEAFKEMMQDLNHGITPPRHKISGEGTFYSKKSIESLKKIIDINNSEEVDKKARAFYFPNFEMAYFELANKKYYVLPTNKN